MPTKIRRKSASVIQDLQKRTSAYPFFQAVRLLLRSAIFANRKRKQGRLPAADNPIARHTPPNTEFLRFTQSHTLGFPHSEIEQLHSHELSDGKRQWQMQVNFMSLIGSTGVLPFHYTELIFQRLKFKDQSLKDFLALFNHRTVSLFYQAGLKYRLPQSYELHQLTNRRDGRVDDHTHVLLSLIGLGTGAIKGSSEIPYESLIYYAGLLNQNTRSAVSLKNMLSEYFGVPIQVDQFVGEWHDLVDDVRTRLPSLNQPLGQNVCLGTSSILGGKGWYTQGKIKVVVGPLNKAQFARFSPGTNALKCLDGMVKRFSGPEMETEYVIKAKRKDLPTRIQLRSKNPTRLGWDTWLATQPAADYDQDRSLDIKVSSARFH